MPVHVSPPHRGCQATAVTAGSDAGGLASQHLCALAAPSWRTPAARSTPLVESGLDVLVAALRAAAGLSIETSHQVQMLGSVKRYALPRLGDPDLSPGSVAAALYISPRQLHRLFAREQTAFGGWLREQRLSRSRGLRGIAWDLPGFGLAERPKGYDYSWTGLGRFAAAAAEELQLERFHPIVHGVGGPVGFELAAAQGQ
jgi:hypothetical protein